MLYVHGFSSLHANYVGEGGWWRLVHIFGEITLFVHAAIFMYMCQYATMAERASDT